MKRESSGAERPPMNKRLGVMSDVNAYDLVDLWNIVLEYQTTCFGPEELRVLEEWGFAQTPHGVLDAGCGNGDYGRFLAARFPSTTFLGVEANQAFIDEFDKRLASGLQENYRIAQCDLGSDPFPEAFRGRFDQCLLRLVLQHVPTPISVLRYLHRELPQDGKIFVIEEDDGFFNIYPECKAYSEVVALWKTVCERAGSVRYIGREIPDLLTRAGFTVKRVKVLLHTNFEVGEVLLDYLVATAKMLQLTNPDVLEASEPERLAKEFRRYLDKHGSSWFAVYPQVITMAEKNG